MTSVDQLTRHLLESRSQDVDAIFALLDEFFDGAPLRSLEMLLESPNVQAVRAGVFIASELAVMASPLKREIDETLAWQDTRIRCDAIDALLTTTDERDKGILGRVVSLAAAPDAAVRFSVANFLARARPGQIRAAADGCESEEVLPLIRLYSEMVTNGNKPELAALRDLLDDRAPHARVFGLAMFSRYPGVGFALEQELLSSGHEDIRKWMAALIDVDVE